MESSLANLEGRDEWDVTYAIFPGFVTRADLAPGWETTAKALSLLEFMTIDQ
jgi:hypothetical protein